MVAPSFALTSGRPKGTTQGTSPPPTRSAVFYIVTWLCSAGLIVNQDPGMPRQCGAARAELNASQTTSPQQVSSQATSCSQSCSAAVADAKRTAASAAEHRLHPTPSRHAEKWDRLDRGDQSNIEEIGLDGDPRCLSGFREQAAPRLLRLDLLAAGKWAYRGRSIEVAIPARFATTPSVRQRCPRPVPGATPGRS